MVLDTTGLVIYFIILLAVGFHAVRYVKSLKDFAIAGGVVPWVIIFATASATYLGSGATMVNANYGSSSGYVIWFGTFGFAIAFVLAGTFVAEPLRRYVGAYTPADVMGYHYGHVNRVFVGFLSFAYMVGILGSQIFGLGIVLNAFAGIPMAWGIVIGMAVVIVYSVLGGLFAVIHTDIVQFVAMAVFLPVTLLIILFKQASAPGGILGTLEQVPATHFSVLGEWPAAALISFFFMLLLGESLAPHFTARVFASETPAAAKKGIIVGGVFLAAFMFVTTTIGVFARAIRPELAGDQVLPGMILDFLPSGIAGAAIAAIIAAIMSTSDSSLAVAGIIFKRDILEPLTKKKYGRKADLNITRFITLIVGILATLFALQFTELLAIFQFIFPFWAASVLVPFVLAIIWGKGSPYAAFFAMMGGVGTFAIWYWGLGEPYGFSSILPSVFVSIIVFFIVHAITSGKEPARGFKPPEKDYHVHIDKSLM